VVLGSIINSVTGSSENNNKEPKFSNQVAKEAVKEYDVLKSELQNDRYKQSSLENLIDQTNLNVSNLKTEQVGNNIIHMGVLAQALALREILDNGIGHIEDEVKELEHQIKVEESESYRHENKLEELETRLDSEVRNNIQDLKKALRYEEEYAEEVEQEINLLEQNAEETASIIERGIEQGGDAENYGERVRKAANGIIEIRNNDKFSDMVYRVEENVIDGKQLNQLVQYIIRLHEELVNFEKDINNLEEAVKVLELSIEMSEESELISEIESIPRDINFNENQKILILEVLDKDQHLNKLEQYSQFDKREFKNRLSSMSSEEIIESAKEVDRFTSIRDSNVNDLKKDLSQIEQKRENIETEIGQVVQKGLQLEQDLDEADQLISKFLDLTERLTNKLQQDLQDLKNFESKLEKIEELERIPSEWEKVIEEEDGEIEAGIKVISKVIEKLETADQELTKVHQLYIKEEDGLDSAINKLGQINLRNQ